MADTPPLPAGFEQIPLASASPAPVTTAASAAATTPSGMDAEVYRSTLDHLVNTGATRDQIGAFIRSAGFPDDHVHGIEASLAYRDDPRNRDAKGNAPRIQVLPIHDAVPTIQHAAPTEAQNQPAVESLPEGFEEVPMDQIAPTAQNDAPQSALGEMGLGVRHMLEGAAAIPDTLIGLGALVNGHEQKLTVTKGVDALLNAFGVPNDASDSDRLVGKMVAGATGGVLTGGEMAAAPLLAAAMGGAGAGGGSELARQSGYGPAGQLAAGLAGGLAGGSAVAGGGSLANALARERVGSQMMQAFDRQGVPALPADVGGILPQMATAATKTTLGGLPLYDAARASVNAARAARDRIASSIGNATDVTGAGQAIRRGTERWMDATKTTGGKLYEAIPIPADRGSVLTNTKQALSDLTAGLKSNPELSRVIEDPRMQRIAEAVQGRTVQVPTGLLDTDSNPIMRNVQQGGALSWQDLKDFRTYIGEKAGAQALQSDIPQARLKALYGALSRDMEATATADGPKALAAFRRANTYWRARQQRISDVIEPILGKDGANTADEAFRAIQSWTGSKADFMRTAQAFRSLPEDEANTVRATIFSRLGNAKSGAQNAEGTEFSPAVFATQWDKLARENPRALTVLFPGEQYRKDIADLVKITNAQKAAGRFANTSGTGLAMHMAPGVGLFHDPLSLVIQYGAGKLLSLPKFARWLASAPNKPNAAAQLAHVNRLASIAAAQPAIANDVLALQERLAKAFSGQPLAAEEQGQ